MNGVETHLQSVICGTIGMNTTTHNPFTLPFAYMIPIFGVL